jgi:hypothetical protein
MTGHAKPVGIALSSEHLTALLEDRALTERLNAPGLPFAIAGIDRVASAVPRPGLGLQAPVSPAKSSVAVATLADWAPDLGWLTVAAVNRDQSYSLARRVASADYLSGGRSGLVLGLRDRLAPAGCDGREVYPGESLPASPAATREAAAAIRALWASWSAESALSGCGEFDLDNPITVPASPQGAPVLAWRAESTGEAAADVLIWPAGRPEPWALVAASSGGTRLFLEMPAGGSDLAGRLAHHLAGEHVAGVILRPEGSEAGLREFAARTLPGLIRSGALRTGWSGTLRERLSLPVPQLQPAPARTVLPVPAPAFAA